MTTGALGLLEVDNGIKVDEILLNVYRSRKRGDLSHPFLLPLCLFEEHIRESASLFVSLFREIQNVETEIRPSLDEASEAERKKQGRLYGTLSKRLHVCGSQLGELAHRRTFEKRLAAAFRDEMEENIKVGLAKENPSLRALSLRIRQATDMAASHDSMIEALPDRIRSQTTLVSLVTTSIFNSPQPSIRFLSSLGSCQKIKLKFLFESALDRHVAETVPSSLIDQTIGSATRQPVHGAHRG
jgi:hypothetical protein